VAHTAALAGLDPSSWQRHALHGQERIWLEKNCYIDIWIELLHGLRLEPTAMLAFTLATDFEGDQWTFFKPSHEELRELYGIDVQEMYLWRPLLEHALEHLGGGKFISTEADAYWLPDTAGTDYRIQHTKTTIVLNEIDLPARRLGYFHNAGYHTLAGEDFASLMRLEAAPDAAFMPLYAELIRVDRLQRQPLTALRLASRALLRKHLQRLPLRNPIRAFQERFDADLRALTQSGLATYHLWAFGTLRQLGAASELASLYLDWLDDTPERLLHGAAEAYLQIANLSKTFILKAARAVNSARTLDSAVLFEPMALAWEHAGALLRARA
jgi:hypothetical protein